MSLQWSHFLHDIFEQVCSENCRFRISQKTLFASFREKSRILQILIAEMLLLINLGWKNLHLAYRDGNDTKTFHGNKTFSKAQTFCENKTHSICMSIFIKLLKMDE
jgi:hypothetical protein